MAQYEHLKLYKAAFDFLVYFAKIVPHYQREYRYTIAEKLIDTIVEAIVLIYRANGARNMDERADFITKIQDKMQYVSILMRLSCAIQALTKQRYDHALLLMMDIEKQLSGWKSYVLDRMKVQQKGIEKDTQNNIQIFSSPSRENHAHENETQREEVKAQEEKAALSGFNHNEIEQFVVAEQEFQQLQIF